VTWTIGHLHTVICTLVFLCCCQKL